MTIGSVLLRNCNQCKKEFEYKFVKSPRKFCNDCSEERHRIQNRVLKDKYRNKIKTYCVMCAKPLKKSNSRCCNQCAVKWYKMEHDGTAPLLHKDFEKMMMPVFGYDEACVLI